MLGCVDVLTESGISVHQRFYKSCIDKSFNSCSNRTDYCKFNLDFASRSVFNWESPGLQVDDHSEALQDALSMNLEQGVEEMLVDQPSTQVGLSQPASGQ